MTQKLRKWFKFRVCVVFFLFILVTITILLRAYYLQILKHEKLSQFAEKQQNKVIAIPSKRGVIYDRNREEIAISIDVDSIYANPLQVANARLYAKKLSPVLGISKKELIEKLQGKRSFSWIKRKASPEESTKVENLKLKGIHFIKEPKRFYPNREIAGNIVGFVGLDGEGLEGLELKYEEYLKGETSYSLVERDAFGRTILSRGVTQREEVIGHDLVLTIDNNIQYIAEKELEEVLQKSKAKSGSVVVMVPKTGEILAIAIQPRFNPNAFSKSTPDSWRNRAVTDCFEPGSTFKVFLLAGALEKGIVSKNDIFFCENGSYKIGRRTIHDTHPHGWLTVKDIIKFSSNIGTSKVAERLGGEEYFEYIREFGFGERTGIDVPGEVSGILRRPKRWSQIAITTASFGQGISVSAIQLITAYCAIVNKGLLMRPYVVKHIVNSHGKTVKEFQPQIVRRVVSEETAEVVTSILKTTVEEGGTGTKASISGYEVAGKTGTAQKPNPSSGGYFRDKYIASFIGSVPADNPEIAILVIVDEPKGIFYGGAVAGPVFKEVARKTLRYLGVLPAQMAMEEESPLFKKNAKNYLPEVPSFQERRESNQGGKFTMPDLTGMSMRQVLKTMDHLKVDIRIVGSGRAIEQSLMPGRAVRGGEKCWIKFQQPS